MTTKYGVMTTTDLLQLHVVKATTDTPVDADWDSQDSANSPRYVLGNPGNEIVSHWAFEFGADIHIAAQQRNGKVRYHLFDPRTDTWTTVDELVAAAGDTGFDNAPATHAVSISVNSAERIYITAAYNDGTNERLRLFSKTADDLFTMGFNAAGQLGINSQVDQSNPVQVASDKHFSLADFGEEHVLGIKVDGALWVWGSGTNGRLGDGTTVSKSSMVQIGSGTDWDQVSAGGFHSLAIKRDNSLWSWGENGTGPLGQSDTTDRSSPVQVGSDTDWELVGSGRLFSLAIRTDGTLWAWGDNSPTGHLGIGTSVDVSSPVQVGGLTTWVSASGGELFSVGLRSNGTIYAWGDAGFGQIGDSTTVDKSSPTQVGSLTTWKQISAGGFHVLAVKTDGTLWAWGRALNGRLGNNQASTDESSPIQIGSLTDWDSVSAGNLHSMALKTDGTLWTWGNNAVFGALGDGTVSNRSSPTLIGSMTNWISVSGGKESALARSSNSWVNEGECSGTNTADYTGVVLFPPASDDRMSWAYKDNTSNNVETRNIPVTSSNTIHVWGIGTSGQLGNNTAVSISSPVQLGADGEWDRIFEHSAVKDGTLWMWSFNNDGQLGTGDTVNKSSPTQVGALTDWSSGVYTFGAGTATLAVKTDGTLWAWGRCAQGACGDGATASRSSPIQIGSLTDWKYVSTSVFASAAVKTDGTLWSWGGNGDGQLGQGNTTSISSPAQVGSATDWVICSMASDHLHAINEAGEMWGVGQAVDAGEVGDGTRTDKSSLVQIGTGETWAHVHNSGSHIGAITTDGKLFTWGANLDGKLGNGIPTLQDAPFQVGTDTNWAWVNVSDDNTVAVRTNGTIWAWGDGADGNCGDGTTISRSSPVQIGSLTKWSAELGQLAGRQSLNIEAPVTIDADVDTATIVTAPGVIDSASKIYLPYIDKDGSLSIASWTSAAAPTFPIAATDDFLYALGANNAGQLGDGFSGAFSRSSPVQIGALGNWGGIDSYNHTIAVKTDGTLWAWGDSANGKLGDGQIVIDYSSPIQIGALTTWEIASAEEQASHAIKTDGTLWGWGENLKGHVGDDTTIFRSSPVQIGGLTTWKDVGGGDEWTLAIKDDGTIWSWGEASSGRLGQNQATTDRSSPVQIGALTTWDQISTSVSNVSHAIKTDGTLWGWGFNADGEIGDNTIVARSSPVQVGALTTWELIKDGLNFAVAIKTDGTLWTWGDNGSGQLGQSDTTLRSSPTQVGSDSDWNICEASSFSVWAIKDNGELWAWGLGSAGQLGQNNTTSFSSPVQVGADTDWISMGAGTTYVHLVRQLVTDITGVDETLVSRPVLGQEKTTPPHTAAGLAVTVDDVHMIYVERSPGGVYYEDDVDGGIGSDTLIQNPTSYSIWVWGFNGAGQLGQENLTSLSSPVQVGSDSGWAFTDTGSGNQTVGVKANGELWIWGAGTVGALGDNTTISKSSPVQVGALTDWGRVDIGAFQNHSIKTDGTLWAWGDNNQGEVGDGTLLDRSSPVQIGSDTDWAVVDDGDSHTFAIRNDGTLWSWGNATFGRLANNTTTPNISSPVQIGALTDWSEIACADEHAIALKTNGELWAWGANEVGQLGDGTTTSRSSPVQIGALTTWTEISAGGDFGANGQSVAIKTDGTMWSWGEGGNGRTGHNDTADTSSPVQIGSDTDWSTCSAGFNGMSAIRTDGTLWTWGLGTDGLNGDGTILDRSSPVQIGSATDWVISHTGFQHTSALRSSDAQVRISTRIIS